MGARLNVCDDLSSPPAASPRSTETRAPFLRVLLPLAFMVTGCSPAPQGAATPAPASSGATPMRTVSTASVAGDRIDGMLTPPEAALRAAENLMPNGSELGTMWTFENTPVERWRRLYGFDATPEWLEHVRLSSVRFGEICSASFVSANGLVMTNHHCARDCVEGLSTDQTDYVVEGFQARTRADELVCPELYLDQLVAIEDVTARMLGAAPSGAGTEQITQAREGEIERIQNECASSTGNECQVVSLFQGGQFQLYTYKRYQPVKLVFAPELQAGFYGGDPDNFTYPRYALDVSFVRAYEADGATPAATPHFFEWDPEGADEEEVVFITGNPGTTSRLITLGQLLYERSYRHPFLIQLLEGQRALLQGFADQGPEQARAVRDDLFGVENSLKAFSGQLRGLSDTLLVATKISWEEAFRQRASQTPAARDYLDVWDRLRDIQARKIETSPALNVANAGLLGSPHLGYAGQLVAYLEALEQPAGERGPGLQGDRMEQVRQMLEQPSMIPDQQALPPLQRQLAIAEQWLPASHHLRLLLMNQGEDAEAAALRLARTSRVLDSGFRQSLMNAGAAALDTVSDPLVRAAVAMDSAYAVTLPRWEALVAEETVEKGRLAQALFAVYGTDLPPDATFTLRISDGVVKRYPYNGTFAPPVTTIYGLYARSAEFQNEMPWTLPPAFEEARDRVDMSKPFNFVSTNDITGGNSGSPMIDQEARVVGIAFDGNVEQLPNEFVFRTQAGRTVAVHSAGILEALRNVYQAEALVEELLAGAP